MICFYFSLGADDMEFNFIELKDLTKTLTKDGKANGIVFLVDDSKTLGAQAIELDKQSGGLLSKAINSPRFAGKAGQSVCAILSGHDAHLVAIIGLGKTSDINHLSYEKAGGEAVKIANQQGLNAITIVIENGALDKGKAEAHALFGARLGAYRFGKYFTTKSEDELPTLQHFAVAGDKKSAKKQYEDLEHLADSIIFTRDIVSEPANIIHPESLAQICKDLSKFGLEVEVLGEKQMQKLGMWSLLGVGQGSEKESQLVILKWNGADDKKAKPVAFVGKGVCFDTGGISIKPAGGMEEMKWDMGGAGTVIGLLRNLAARGAKVNAVGVVGLVENMPDGNAQRPGDVVKSYSGQTIEVLNTDAEGRLVLADALWYCQEQFKPQFMVDLATLTGAIIVSLGSKYAGLFSSDDELAQRISGLGKDTGDETWRLPLDDYYDKQINSEIADMQNIGTDREAGSITAAQFLKRFTNDVPWAHLDIAGTAWRKKPTATSPKGATGYGVRLLDSLVAKYYEEK
jgi:leucyl aminopeptidase